MRDHLPDSQNELVSDIYVEALTLMLESDSDVRGTVASLAREVEEQAIDGTFGSAYETSTNTKHPVDTRFSLGPYVMKTLDRKDLAHLVSFYRSTYPTAHVTDHSTITDDYRNTNFVSNKAKSHSHLILDGRRITPSNSLKSAPNSIIQVQLDGKRYVGQMFSILTHRQPGVNKDEILLDVRWFKRLENINTTHWDDLYLIS
jgi:hypothetical protein